MDIIIRIGKIIRQFIRLKMDNTKLSFSPMVVNIGLLTFKYPLIIDSNQNMESLEFGDSNIRYSDPVFKLINIESINATNLRKNS